MRSVLPKLGLWAAMTLALAASALPAAAFIGSFRGPKVDGELALPGLSAPVRVLRDEHGIPYIFAANTPDLIRAQGFVVAQGRLFQIEGYRAIATGRLAESVGPGGLASDRQIRLLGLRRNAERHAKLLSPEARDFLMWFLEGMNAYIEGHADDHPLELKLAGFTPRPWSLQDMVTVLHFVNWSQAANFKAELNMQKLIDKFGADKALRELAPMNVNPFRTQQPVIVGDAAGARPLGPVQLLVGLDEPDAPLAPSAPIAVGSNNWAVGKSRTASGAAVLVNDPHLDARMLPGVWFPVGLFAPGHPGGGRGAAGGARHPGRAHGPCGLRRDQRLRRFAGPVHREGGTGPARSLCRWCPGAALPGDRGESSASRTRTRRGAFARRR